MDSVKPTPSAAVTKLSKTFRKVIHLRRATRSLSDGGFCLLLSQEKLKPNRSDQGLDGDEYDEEKAQHKAYMEALVAKLFSSISTVKAAYAELQMAQSPYDGEAIHSADDAVVRELEGLSELKQTFLKQQIDSSPPHVTLLLAEIQEQQNLMKIYGITMRKMQLEIETKESEISSLETELKQTSSNCKSLQKRFNSSGSFSFSVLDAIKPSAANLNDFVTVLHYTLRSVRSFVRLMIGEMESANWNIDSAARAVEPEISFRKPQHRCFAFESFVCREIFNCFDRPSFSLRNESCDQRRLLFINRFKKLKAVNPIPYLQHNPNSTFGKFCRGKYLRLVHPKMEASFSGNLNQRHLVNSGDYPDTPFFAAFAEMSKRVWLLHCLAFSFDRDVNIFQVRRHARFSEVYMASVIDDDNKADGNFQVAFTVVPGFKIGKTVIQSQVYPSPAKFPFASLS